MDLYKGDCFDIFPKIKDRSVDLFLLDLPFNQTSVAWDKDIIDLDKMWIEIKRMMKKSGIIVFFCTARFGYRLIHSNPKWFKYDLIYKKGKKAVGFLSANKRQLRAHENIYVFKEEQGVYNPQKTPREKDYKHSGKRSREDHYGNIIDCKKEYKKAISLKVGDADEEGLTTSQKWYRNNREYAIAMAGEWYRNNKEKILLRRKKEYYENKIKRGGDFQKNKDIMVSFE